MMGLRRFLGRFAAACVVVHALGTAVPAVALWATTVSDCTCATGDHAMCPMHHHRPSKTGCAMRAAADDGTAMLTPLTIVGVVTPAAGSIPVPAVRAASTTTNDRVAVARPVPPDPPPPRA